MKNEQERDNKRKTTVIELKLKVWPGSSASLMLIEIMISI